MPHRLLQLTDLHLFSDPAGRLHDIPTRANLDEVLAHIAEHAGPLDCAVVTGDLAQDERLESYAIVRDACDGLGIPYEVLPGNHDNRDRMRQVFPDIGQEVDGRVTFVRTLGPWRLIGLDSQIPGKVPGLLGAAQLEWLRGMLEDAAPPTLLFVHHPPFEVGSPWIDRLRLEDDDELLELIEKHPCVRGIAAGHVHQVRETVQAGVRLMTSPATAFQFVPDVPTAMYHAIPPGYRVFELNESSFRSEVVRLPELKYPPDQLAD